MAEKVTRDALLSFFIDSCYLLENYRKVLQEEISKGLPEGSELKIYQSQQQLWENNNE